MRDLASHELAQVNGGYYFSNVVATATDGMVFGSFIALGAAFANPAAPIVSFATAIYNGALIGAAVGFGEELAIDLDIAAFNFIYGPFSSSDASA